MRYAHFAKICKNAAKCQIRGNRIFVFFWHAYLVGCRCHDPFLQTGTSPTRLVISCSSRSPLTPACCYRHGWLPYVLNLISTRCTWTSAISYTTEGLHFQLNIYYMKHDICFIVIHYYGTRYHIHTNSDSLAQIHATLTEIQCFFSTELFFIGTPWISPSATVHNILHVLLLVHCYCVLPQSLSAIFSAPLGLK